MYKTIRGVSVPIYDLGHRSLGFLDKVRGEDAWAGCIWLDRDVLFGMIGLLQGSRDVYLYMQEVKEARVRRIRDVSLQTEDPEIE